MDDLLMLCRLPGSYEGPWSGEQEHGTDVAKFGGEPMSGSQDFFRTRQPQAVFKHGILSRYPVVFASKTGQSRKVVFLDGYAGRGEYKDGSPGSPLLLSRTAKRVGDFRYVTGIYVERNKADFQNLQQVMAEHGRPEDVVLGGDLHELLPRVLQTAQATALFAFLDPFGTALDREQLVDHLLNRQSGRAPTEVLLHISISTVARIGGLLRRRREAGALSPADRKTIAHADRFLGGTWWQQHFEPVKDQKDERGATAAALEVAAKYQKRVEAGAHCMSLSMPIRHKPGQLPKYLLVLFTRHVDGLWNFADAVGKAGREWEGAWRSAEMAKARTKAAGVNEYALFGVDTLLPPAEEPFDIKEYEKAHHAEWVRIIEQNIVRLLERHNGFVPVRRLAEVYDGVFGAAAIPQVRAAMKSLYQQGVITNNGIGDFQNHWVTLTGPTSRSA
ncbi:three-Cys-motif partner protein TcmP [Amycolatopsis japonica]